MSPIKKLLKWLLYVMKNITVEPVVFLSIAGSAIYNTPATHALYYRYCQVYHKDLQYDCEDESTWTVKLENHVQGVSADWDIYTSIASVVPSIFIGLFLGAWGDKHGRAISITLGLGGTIIGLFLTNVVLSEKYEAGLWWLIIGQLITGLTGTFTLVPINMFAYLSDITQDQKLLAFRITMVYATVNAALIIGSFIAVGLISVLHDQTVACVGFVIVSISLFVCIVMIPQIPPPLLKPMELLSLEGRKRSSVSTISAKGSIRRSRSELLQTLTMMEQQKGVFKSVMIDIRDGLRTYYVPRAGHRRCFLLWMAFFYFCIMGVFGETKGSTMQYYTHREKGERGIAWDALQYSVWLAVTGVLNLVGSVIAISILQKWFKVRDTVVILFGLASRAGKAIIIGLASKGWHLYMASIAGMIADITRPGIYGFTTHLVAQDETGKAFTMFGLAENVAFVFGSVVFDSIYKHTIDVFAGILFFVIGGLIIFLLGVMTWIHFVAEKEEIGIMKKTHTFDLKGSPETGRSTMINLKPCKDYSEPGTSFNT